ncbi:hypothetical protein H0H93_000537 [Arthromyces matolae]|nr:hypothetical protein H0H93_000537 [Arthromyces matolae]
MPNPMFNNHAARGGGLGRNHNYHAIYEPDPKGEEAAENARVWRVYLDEADAHDADMIVSLRTILDSLLVFASLFSAVVTTFVAQTSQVLGPDNAQITVALLTETNQLLRAGGNGTKIDFVPIASLSLNSITYTLTDVWVNGLFFTSLTLSVTTALLTVLAKQWIQAYIEVVSGSAKTQAIIRQFRYDGLVKWKLGSIIEGLPLILHSSVGIFLIGLSLYVSQISLPICVVISCVTALTFAFYVATSMIPAFSPECPFRLSSMFFLARWLWIVSHPAVLLFKHLLKKLFPSWKYNPRYDYLEEPPLKTLKMEEYRQAIGPGPLEDSTPRYTLSSLHEWKSLSWLFALSTDNSVKDIVLEGASSTLDRHHKEGWRSELLKNPATTSFLWRVLLYCSSRQNDLGETSNSSEIIPSMWDAFITKVLWMAGSGSPELLPTPEAPRNSANWECFELCIWKCYVSAWQSKNNTITKFCLRLIRGLQMEYTIRSYLCKRGNRYDIFCAMDKDTKDLFLTPDVRWGDTLLHRAAYESNLEAIIGLLETNPEWIDLKATFSAKTPLDNAISPAFEIDFDPRIVEYLLDHGASATPLTLHRAAKSPYPNADSIKYLLDRGWDRTGKDSSGAMPVDLARLVKESTKEFFYMHERQNQVIDCLENYQTAPLPHPLRIPPPTLEHIDIATGAIPLDQAMSVHDEVAVGSRDSVEVRVILWDERTSSVEEGTGDVDSMADNFGGIGAFIRA